MFARSLHILFLLSYREKCCTVDYGDQLRQQWQIVLLAYLLGSIPTTFLVGRRMGSQLGCGAGYGSSGRMATRLASADGLVFGGVAAHNCPEKTD